MHPLNSLKTNAFHTNDQNFKQHAIELFHFQYNNNKIYHEYVQHLGVSPSQVTDIIYIPFLPIQFFKNHKIVTGNFKVQHVFESSGTTGSTSRHYIEDLTYYREICLKTFTSFFGGIEGSVIIGLLPSYLERGNSSLVCMIQHFIEKSGNPDSGFYLDNLRALSKKLEARTASVTEAKVFLFGVTFALQELAKDFPFTDSDLRILETGGMKGRGRELVREELHKKLKEAFGTTHVFSEYGMTELLSQAYLLEDGLFHTPPWMRIYIREIHDPFSECRRGQTGVINVIDLANVHSCAFVGTEDIGIQIDKGFKVLGRLDNSDLRGCNLMLS